MEELWRAVGWKRLVATALCLAAWRTLEQVTVPGVNPGLIAARLSAVDTSSLIHAIGPGSIALTPYSIVTFGLGPYINALIIVWAVELVSRRARAIGRTDEGRVRILRWARALTVVLAMGQAYGWTILMQSGSVFPSSMDWFPRLLICSELTVGTLILVGIADVLDEYGIGFGYGAFLMYAITPLAVEVHRLADELATAPSVEALYFPFAIWLAFSIGIVVLTIAVSAGVRRLQPGDDKKTKPAVPVELPVLVSGVLRPPMFMQALLLLPLVIANYYSVSNPGLMQWIIENATPYGRNPWGDTAYVAIEALLVIGFTYFVVAGDLRVRDQFTGPWIPHMNRLTLICGMFLVITVVVLPAIEWNASLAAGTGIGVSGFDAVLLVAVTAAIVATLERAARIPTPLRVPTSALP